MATLVCKCGRTTNTTVCNHMKVKPGEECTECYGAWNGQKWVKGCSYDKADPFIKQFVDKIMKGGD